jgi:dihydroorotate dehydrogenase electron transfer subunit
MQVKADITSILEVMSGTYLIWLEAPGIATVARPGQFVMMRCGPLQTDTVLPRPFSVHRVDGDRLAILFNLVGKGTRWLSTRKKGETLDIFGPLGNGYTISPDSRNLLLVAGGIGIAPLCFLTDVAVNEGKKVTILMGAGTGDRLLPISASQSLYERGMQPASIHVVNATDDGSEGYKGPVTDLIPAYLDGIDQIFACGPVSMYKTISQIPELKNKPVQLSLEIVMGCGIGVCYGCTIRTKQGLKQVCRDGPVFEMGEMDWEYFRGVKRVKKASSGLDPGFCC